MGNESSTPVPGLFDNEHELKEQHPVSDMPVVPINSTVTGERTQWVIDNILRRREEIIYLLRVAGKNHGELQGVLGSEPWHITAESQEMDRLKEVFNQLSSEQPVPNTTPVAVLEDDLSLCEKMSNHLRLAINDYRRIRDMRDGMRMCRYSYNSCTRKDGTLYLTGTHLVWDDADQSNSCFNQATKLLSRGVLRFPFTDMNNLMVGTMSNPLKYQKETGDKNRAPAATPWLCFTVICSNRTCDFSVQDEDSLITWVRGLSCILDSHLNKGLDEQGRPKRDYELLSESDIKTRISTLKATVRHLADAEQDDLNPLQQAQYLL